MVGQHKELTFFKVVSKVTNGKVDCEEFKTELMCCFGFRRVGGVLKRTQVVAKRY